MSKKRANGEGNIRKRSDGRWEGRYTAGYDPDTGKRIIKNVLGKTQAEVKAKLAAAIETNSKLDASKRGKYTVGAWLDAWLENYAGLSVRPSTHQTYQGFIKNHLKPTIGELPLDKLTGMDLQRLYKHLLEGGRVQRRESAHKPKGLSVKTVRNIHQMLSSALDQAVMQKLLSANPAAGCALPKLEKREMKTLTSDQLGAFFQEARNSGVYEMYYLDLSTGLRRGELLGLKWSDVDLDKGVITVRRQISRQAGPVVEAPPKTQNSYRSIAIPDAAVGILKAHKDKVGSSEWVFPSPNGGPISPDSVRHMLHRVLKRAGLPMIRFHDLRHTFATLALQNGVDIKTVSGMLGHYSAGFTRDTNAHVTADAQVAAEKTMAGVLEGNA